jgi:long-chain fatty acid transport protein
VDDIVVHFKTPGAPDSVMAEDLENTFAYKLGAEYACSKRLALRCGYIYNENATPEETWRPSLPDTVTHFFLTGFGYKMKNVTLDGALQLVYYEKRTIDNNVDLNETFSSSSIDGTYRVWAPCVSFSATYRF